jgi:hypothetical protein
MLFGGITGGGMTFKGADDYTLLAVFRYFPGVGITLVPSSLPRVTGWAFLHGAILVNGAHQSISLSRYKWGKSPTHHRTAKHCP